VWVRGPVALSFLVLTFTTGAQWATRDLVTTQQLTDAAERVRGQVARLDRHDVSIAGLERLSIDNAGATRAVLARLDALAEQRAILLRQYDEHFMRLDDRVEAIEEMRSSIAAVLARLTGVERLLQLDRDDLQRDRLVQRGTDNRSNQTNRSER
jgi:hypothetical protein